MSVQHQKMEYANALLKYLTTQLALLYVLFGESMYIFNIYLLRIKNEMKFLLGKKFNSDLIGKFVAIKGAKLSSYKNLSLSVNNNSLILFNDVNIDRVRQIIDWHSHFKGNINKLSQGFVIFMKKPLEQVINDNNQEILFFETKSKICNSKKSYYYGCTNKICNNIAVKYQSNKLSQCLNCETFVIPKNVLKLQVQIGLTEYIWATCFDDLAERLSEHLKSNKFLFFRIKKYWNNYNVINFFLLN